ncbi:MAG: hypothetical protein ACREDH_15605 [Methylocella sp.]
MPDPYFKSPNITLYNCDCEAVDITCDLGCEISEKYCATIVKRVEEELPLEAY